MLGAVAVAVAGLLALIPIQEDLAARVAVQMDQMLLLLAASQLQTLNLILVGVVVGAGRQQIP
jgi:hypothetical protein